MTAILTVHLPADTPHPHIGDGFACPVDDGRDWMLLGDVIGAEKCADGSIELRIELPEVLHPVLVLE